MPPARRRSSPNDQHLVEALKRGELVPFEELYAAYLPRVRSVCRRYLSDPRDVEEAVQDTFVKAANALPRFNGSFRLAAWMARIAANTAMDLSRKNRRRRELVSGAAEDLVDPSTPSEDESPASIADPDVVLGRIRPEHARALRLRGLEKATHVEIGRALGKSPNQVKALLHRARESFRRAWRDHGGRVAFFGVAGAIGLWRLYRGAAASSPALARVQSAATTVESFAPPVAAVTDALPWV